MVHRGVLHNRMVGDMFGGASSLGRGVYALGPPGPFFCPKGERMETNPPEQVTLTAEYGYTMSKLMADAETRWYDDVYAALASTFAPPKWTWRDRLMRWRLEPITRYLPRVHVGPCRGDCDCGAYSEDR
mgnify:FL=1